MPKILITQELRDQRTVRTVVDGQQRLRSIFDFISGNYTILKSHNQEHGGRKFADLTPEAQSAILQYEIGVDLLFNVDLADLLDIFARINTYSVTLNTQEKLNAKYLGTFKTYAYELGHQFAAYFLDGNVLTEKAISRMAEAQLASDLLVSVCGGVQTNKNIEKYYKIYEKSEDAPQELKDAKNLFHETMAYIGAIYNTDDIKSTNWSRQHWFYTLFTTVAHALRPVEGLPIDIRPVLDLDRVGQWRSTLDNISALYDYYTADDAPDAPRDLQQFIDFSRRRTTDTEARVGRSTYALRQLAIG